MATPTERKRAAVVKFAVSEFRAKRFYENAKAMRDDIVRRRPDVYSKTPMRSFVAWFLEAREIVAREGIYVTQPVQLTLWDIDPNADYAKRKKVQGVKLQELKTRTAKQALFARAAASQPDSTPDEIDIAARLGIAAGIIASVADDATNGV